jgi:hypothetical protein
LEAADNDDVEGQGIDTVLVPVRGNFSEIPKVWTASGS